MDAPEVAVAKFAARISEWALFLSGGSFVVAACAFALELRRWFDESVKLSMSVIPEATIIGGVRDENSYMAITATNRGSAATTITHMVLYNYPDRLSLCLSRWPLIIFKRPRRLSRWFVRHGPKTMIVKVVVQTLEVEPIRGLEVALDHAASTAFQISGAVLCLTRSLSSLN